MSRFALLFFTTAALFAVSACSGGGDSATAEKTSAATADKKTETKKPKKRELSADKVYKTRCVTCHGDSGHGDGPGAAALQPKPRNYSDTAWQDSVTDEDLAKIIVEGGPAVGKSPLMPANPDLKSKKEVVDGIVKIIRGFKGK